MLFENDVPARLEHRLQKVKQNGGVASNVSTAIFRCRDVACYVSGEWKRHEPGYIALRAFMRIPYRIAALVTLLTLLSVSGSAQRRTSHAERELFDAINQERKTHGLRSLAYDEALGNAAHMHAQRMAEQGTISHQLPAEPSLPSRATAAGAHFSWLSENVDQGPSATAIHQSFMKSPQHRANILDGDMDSAGIGVAERNGQMFAVEDFSKAK